ncbi:hypothetical protein EVAR_79433_1 [Eumeta japonica]|uniref:Mariner Mos1 transposase n=1 Tax=Eumeta variegata TaxID=151549 RepID=A0A4C1VFU5_EUMVA|nr:hypothetical protein EVAR_79433_1 [Eumeta japonica]
MIYYDFWRGLTQNQYVDQLISSFGDETPSKPTSGGARRRRRRRPPTASRLKGPRKQKGFAYELLKRGLANLMSPTSTSGVAPPLKPTLCHWFSDESWIYAIDPENKQQLTVWVFQDEPKSIKVIRAKCTLKQMIACFLDINGDMVTVPLKNRKTVNAIRFPEIFEEIRKNRRQRSIIIRRDNAYRQMRIQPR